MQTPDLLALRRAATEVRLTKLTMARSARRANPQSYPITLSYRYLAPQQQAERRENAQDVLRHIDEWERSDRLSERQVAILRTQAAGKPRHGSHEPMGVGAVLGDPRLPHAGPIGATQAKIP